MMKPRALLFLLSLLGCSVAIPEYPIPSRTTWLQQGWQSSERDWYHRADQGTLTFGIPREFFVALEQPEPSASGREMLSDPRYLDRFGFIASDGPLPIGFAVGPTTVDPATHQPWVNPRDNQPFASIGLTCAACHTGRLVYQGKEVLIDGGSGLLNLGQFSKALGLSMVATSYNPLRWQRFADRVLGPNAPAAANTMLRAQFKSALARLAWQHDHDVAVQETAEHKSVEEGFGRLDALNRIGNQVFAINTRQPENYAATSAPVNFPHIWGASWFDWVQYNGSIQQPMVRNAGEALGLATPVVLGGEASQLLRSQLQTRTLVRMEQLLAGPQPKGRFAGLRAPAWPEDVLPKIDQVLAAEGAALYVTHCQGCHRPAPNSATFWAPELWERIGGGLSVLKLKLIPITEIGTDPAQAVDMINRRVAVLPALGIKETRFGLALGELVAATVKRAYDDEVPPVPTAERAALDGFRPNGIRAEPAYKARPLDGIWATPPFLHNGSVPTLYALLTPPGERPTVFHLGNRNYDPVDVGYVTTPLDGDFTLDTTKRGNLNTGHAFDDGPRGNGVIGPKLTPRERRALVEYLKTL